MFYQHKAYKDENMVTLRKQEGDYFLPHFNVQGALQNCSTLW